MRKNLRYLVQPEIQYVLILSGDQLYRMDFRDMIATHESAKADVTIAAKPVSRSEAGAMGIMRVNATGRVVGFLEKPQTDAELNDVAMDPQWLEARGIESRGRDCLASMGIYLFNRETLLAALDKTNYRDFGKEVFPASMRSRHVQMHVFDGYWEDIGTIRAFYDANLRLAAAEPAVRSGLGHSADLHTGAVPAADARRRSGDPAKPRGRRLRDRARIADRKQRDRSAVPHRPRRDDSQLRHHGRRLLRNARTTFGRPQP